MTTIASSFDYHEYDPEHDEHHLNRLLYYCLAIIPILAVAIVLPNTCYSILRRVRDREEEKLD